MPRRPSIERKRTYRQVARAQSAQETEEKILEAATRLFAEKYYDEVTLDHVAELAGVTTKTVMRRFGSKEALAGKFLEGAGQHDAAQRDAVPAGDVDAALKLIIGSYELFGDAVIRNLSLEGRIPMVTAFAEKGRELHSAWVSRVFGPLATNDPVRRKMDLALLLVATDVYTWKLLRRDRKFSEAETAQAVRQLVDQVLRRSSN